MASARDCGPILVLAPLSDPITSGFARFAARHGAQVWQPTCREDVGWSFRLGNPSHSVDIVDRHQGFQRHGGDLAGIWFQSLPPPVGLGDMNDRDRRYVDAELRSSLRMLWYGASFPVIGQPPPGSPPGVFDLGLESRVHLRRLGFPVLNDRIGRLASVRGALAGSPSGNVRVTWADGSPSQWLSELSPRDNSHPQRLTVEDDLVAATVMDCRATLVVLHVDDDLLVIRLDDNSVPAVAPDSAEARAVSAIACQVIAGVGTRTCAIFFGQQGGAWKIARVSLPIPSWLEPLAGDWLFPRLLRVFTERRHIASPIGPSR